MNTIRRRNGTLVQGTLNFPAEVQGEWCVCEVTKHLTFTGYRYVVNSIVRTWDQEHLDSDSARAEVVALAAVRFSDLKA